MPFRLEGEAGVGVAGAGARGRVARRTVCTQDPFQEFSSR